MSYCYQDSLPCEIAEGRRRRAARMELELQRKSRNFIRILKILAMAFIIGLIIYDLAYSAPINAPAEESNCPHGRLTFQSDGGVIIQCKGQDDEVISAKDAEAVKRFNTNDEVVRVEKDVLDLPDGGRSILYKLTSQEGRLTLAFVNLP